MDFSEYAVLNLIIPPIDSVPEQSTHTIYVRPHQSKIPLENDSRSLFLINVPIDSTPSHIRAIISFLIGPGRFESVYFHGENRVLDNNDNQKQLSLSMQNNPQKRKRTTEFDQPPIRLDLPEVWDRKLQKSGSSAIVLLVDEKSVEKSLNAIRRLSKHRNSSKKWPIWGDKLSSSSVIPPLGSARYLAHHKLRFPDPDQLLLDINTYMSDFNAREQAQREADKKSRSQPDTDGFITVSRGGRTGPARKEVVEEMLAIMEKREKKKRDEMQEAGFYRFQGREKRKAEAEELLRQFEEDKRKVQALREKRGKAAFRPEG